MSNKAYLKKKIEITCDKCGATRNIVVFVTPKEILIDYDVDKEPKRIH